MGEGGQFGAKRLGHIARAEAVAIAVQAKHRHGQAKRGDLHRGLLDESAHPVECRLARDTLADSDQIRRPRGTLLVYPRVRACGDHNRGMTARAAQPLQLVPARGGAPGEYLDVRHRPR